MCNHSLGWMLAWTAEDNLIVLNLSLNSAVVNFVEDRDLKKILKIDIV
jgi:hypothetical protein